MDNLRDFVRALDEAGELVRVREPVSTVKEITEVAHRCMKSAGGGSTRPGGPRPGKGVPPRVPPGPARVPQPKPLRAPVPPRPQPHPVRRPTPNRRGQ